MNLAGLEVTARCSGPAISRLAALCGELEDEARPFDRLWYRARFNLAVACLHSLIDPDQREECLTTMDADDRKTLGITATHQLTTRASDVLDYLGEGGSRTTKRTVGPEFQAFVRNIAAAAVVLEADLQRAPVA